VSAASRTILGLFLIVMSIGLLFRSRLAWTIVVALLVGHIGLRARLADGFHDPITAINLALLIMLLLARRTFSRSSLAAGTLFAITSVIALMTLAVVGTYELKDQFNPPLPNVVRALYFVVVTMSTVGYGDIVPQTTEARLFVIALIILGITVFAASLSAVLVPLINRQLARALRHEETQVDRTDHYIIVGDSALADNTAKALRAREQKVTFVVETPSGQEADPASDIVRGDPSNLEVLRQAGGPQAKALLALSEDDSQNAFIVLAMKELSETVKTVALVNSARNLASVRRVHPDLIIAPYVLGGELLAMALSGEHVDGDTLINQLLYLRS